MSNRQKKKLKQSIANQSAKRQKFMRATTRKIVFFLLICHTPNNAVHIYDGLAWLEDRWNEEKIKFNCMGFVCCVSYENTDEELVKIIVDNTKVSWGAAAFTLCDDIFHSQRGDLHTPARHTVNDGTKRSTHKPIVHIARVHPSGRVD